MKKLKLNLGDLKVESFETIPSMNKKGTAHGNIRFESRYEPDTCFFERTCGICPTDATCPGSNTCDGATCDATCANTCPNTCLNTCPNTCNHSCGAVCPTDIGPTCDVCSDVYTCFPCVTVP